MLHFIAHFIFNLQLTKSYLEEDETCAGESVASKPGERNMKLALESSLWLQMSIDSRKLLDSVEQDISP
jgi:hypothetical protein